MTTIIGRLTGDAAVRSLEEGKTVVNFTIAINDYYKPKGPEEANEYTEFVQCAYWYNSIIAASFKKGALVEAGGRIFATAYMAGNEIRPQINLQVQHVKVHVFAKSTNEASGEDNSSDTTSPAQMRTTPQSNSRVHKNKNKRHMSKPGQKPAGQQQEMEGEEPAGDLPF